MAYLQKMPLHVAMTRTRVTALTLTEHLCAAPGELALLDPLTTTGSTQVLLPAAVGLAV